MTTAPACQRFSDASRVAGPEIHVWSAALGKFESELPGYEALLSPSERARAGRFRKVKDRDHYILGRALLRVLLGGYLQQHPAEITLFHGQSGKPEVECGGAMTHPLHFSASYSGEMGVYAIARETPVGVDVERLQPIPHHERIAKRFFSVREAAVLSAVPAECRLESFFACWTRKEAFLKAIGDGIATGLAEVEVTLAPGDPAEILRVPGERSNRSQWQLKSFSPAPGYLAALAYKRCS